MLISFSTFSLSVLLGERIIGDLPPPEGLLTLVVSIRTRLRGDRFAGDLLPVDLLLGERDPLERSVAHHSPVAQGEIPGVANGVRLLLGEYRREVSPSELKVPFGVVFEGELNAKYPLEIGS
mmetsp:Transcript_5612/g.8544  ORF Transcript_5612/g.8544 Transcript_5612/m.8544 type:complete len:122 (-) Transcript_5612:1346-1711(-)